MNEINIDIADIIGKTENKTDENKNIKEVSGAETSNIGTIDTHEVKQ